MSTDSSPILLTVPPIREAAHLALLLAAHTSVPCRLVLSGLDTPTRSSLFAISSLGAEVFRDGSDLLFAPTPRLRPAPGPVHCGPSPTTLAMVLAQAATMARTMDVRASSSVSLDTMRPLLTALESLGATVTRRGPANGPPRLKVQGPIEPGDVALTHDATADHLMALLAALTVLDGTSTVRAPRGIRHPWMLPMATDFGLTWSATEADDHVCWQVTGPAETTRTLYSLPGDWSIGVPLLTGAALMGRPVILHGLRAAGPAAVVLDHLKAFGVPTYWSEGALHLMPAGIEPAGTLDLRSTPELAAPLAVLAAFARGPTVLHTGDLPHLPLLARALQRVGAQVERTAGRVTIQPGDALRGRVGLRTDGHPGLTRALRLLGLRLPAVMVETTSTDPPGYDGLISKIRGWPVDHHDAAR